MQEGARHTLPFASGCRLTYLGVVLKRGGYRGGFLLVAFVDAASISRPLPPLIPNNRINCKSGIACNVLGLLQWSLGFASCLPFAFHIFEFMLYHLITRHLISFWKSIFKFVSLVCILCL